MHLDLPIRHRGAVRSRKLDRLGAEGVLQLVVRQLVLTDEVETTASVNEPTNAALGQRRALIPEPQFRCKDGRTNGPERQSAYPAGWSSRPASAPFAQRQKWSTWLGTS